MVLWNAYPWRRLGVGKGNFLPTKWSYFKRLQVDISKKMPVFSTCVTKWKNPGKYFQCLSFSQNDFLIICKHWVQMNFWFNLWLNSQYHISCTLPIPRDLSWRKTAVIALTETELPLSLFGLNFFTHKRSVILTLQDQATHLVHHAIKLAELWIFV